MFRDVAGCSGMFRDVPECSGMFHVPGFIDARQKMLYPVYDNRQYTLLIVSHEILEPV